MARRRDFEHFEGQELVKAVDIEKIKEKLLRAYADEWVAGYYYMLTAELVQGPLSGVIAEEFKKEAFEEISKHSAAIAERLAELGVEPPRDFSKLGSSVDANILRCPRTPTISTDSL